MFLLYVWQYGCSTEDVLCYVLFFAHQCNTTTTIVSAMCHLLRHLRQTRPYRGTLYHELSEICKSIRKKPDAKADTGSGQHPRFQTTNNKVYDEEEVLQNISGMNTTFAKYRQLMLDVNSSDLKGKLSLYNSLVKEIHEDRHLYKGLGIVRINHLISLASLLGVLPLDFYINLQVHTNGGPGTYVCENVLSSKNVRVEGDNQEENDDSSSEFVEETIEEKVLNWTVETMSILQKSFSVNYTPNMLENSLCIITRSKKSRKSKTKICDPFYHLPYICDRTRRFIYGKKIQLCFRINCKTTKKSPLPTIEVNNGENIYIMNIGGKEQNVITYRRNADGLLCDNLEHEVLDEWIEEVLSYS